MHLPLTIGLMLVAAGAAYANAQYGYGYYPFQTGYSGYPVNQNYFRSGVPEPSFEFHENRQSTAPASGRFFFTTVTLTIATTTLTSTSTTSTTCTTSTKALSVCIPSGRRRRNADSLLARRGRGLVYDDTEEDPTSEGETPFIITPEKNKNAVEEVESVKHSVRESPADNAVPFIVQPGFKAPAEIGSSGRFLLALGTSTVTTTSTTTIITVITATCRSSTSFQACGSTGK